MAALETYQSLKDRKQALLIESDLNRLVLQVELEQLRSSTTRAEGLLSRAGDYATWLVPALSIAGLFAGNKLRKFVPGGGFLKIALGALPLVIRFMRSKKAPH